MLWQTKHILLYIHTYIHSLAGETINVAEPYSSHMGQYGVGNGEMSEAGINVDTW